MSQDRSTIFARIIHIEIIHSDKWFDVIFDDVSDLRESWPLVLILFPTICHHLSEQIGRISRRCHSVSILNIIDQFSAVHSLGVKRKWWLTKGIERGSVLSHLDMELYQEKRVPTGRSRRTRHRIDWKKCDPLGTLWPSTWWAINSVHQREIISFADHFINVFV